MRLPEDAARALEKLESAGWESYAVGGCVRDSLLGIEPHDWDLCTAAPPEAMKKVFAGERVIETGLKHGTLTVLSEDKPVEITTFRTEGAYRDNRHPDWVKFVDSVESDLARRDYTVNAMAYSPTRGFADPFDGRVDLESKVLRAVGDPVTRFQEDSLRILRGVRFAVKYGLSVDPATEDAMESQAQLMDNLAEERIFDELCKLLPLVSAEDLCRFAPILGAVIPELQPMIGFDQYSPHHAYDLFTHTAHVTAGVSADLTLRWAALLHDTGKVATFTRDATGRGHFYGHAQKSAEIADDVFRRLKAPTALREQAVLLIGQHMALLTPDKKLLRRRISRLGWDTLDKLLLLQEADMGGKGTGEAEELDVFPKIRAVLAEIRAENACLTVKDLAVNGNDLLALGYQGKSIGETLNALLEGVLDEALPNERQALLDRAKQRVANDGISSE